MIPCEAATQEASCRSQLRERADRRVLRYLLIAPVWMLLFYPIQCRTINLSPKRTGLQAISALPLTQYCRAFVPLESPMRRAVPRTVGSGVNSFWIKASFTVTLYFAQPETLGSLRCQRY